MPTVNDFIIAPPQWLVAWVALGASLISLGISLITFVVTQRRPRVRLVLPNRVRVSSSAGKGTFVYLQPIFINIGRSTRAEVITPRFVVELPGITMKSFEYSDKSKAVWDPVRREVHVEYADDASPIIVGQNSVRNEMLTFRAPIDWQFAPNEYRCEFWAFLASTPKVLRADFTFAVSEENVRVWQQSEGQRYALIPITETRRSHGRSAG